MPGLCAIQDQVDWRVGLIASTEPYSRTVRRTLADVTVLIRYR